MGDLRSLAYSSLHNSSLGWDFHNPHNNLGVFDTDMSQFLESSIYSTPLLSQLEPDFSTGYLQDALFKFSLKRRRLESCCIVDQKQEDSCNPTWKYWDPTHSMNYFDNCDYLSQIMSKSDNISVEPLSENTTLYSEMKTTEEAISTAETFGTSSSPHGPVNNNQSISDKEAPRSIDPIFPSGGGDENRKKRVISKVVYPFALVKPGGLEGDVTINDINQRILMRPTRAVRHPVGDFARRPLVSPDGPGLSGKAVVALTIIHTQGRGTITIISTRG